MSIWHDAIKPMLIAVIISATLLGSLIFMMGASEQQKFNDGICQVCGEKVMPVGHAYSTSYYCTNCNRYND